MKLIKIDSEDNKPYFKNFKSEVKDEYILIDKIDYVDIYNLIDYIMNHDDAELEPYVADTLQNPAQDLIYKNLESELKTVINSKQNVIKSVNDQFKEAETKYLSTDAVSSKDE